MALKYPDILEHNNPALPLLDDNQLVGGFVVVADKTARNAIPVAKRKIGKMVTWAESGTWYRMAYIGADLLDATWQNDGNWTNIATYNQSETVNRTIYVTTTGSDINGNGSIGNPFLTIGKAISTVKIYIDANITITINVGIGTFSISSSDLIVLSKIQGTGKITLSGTMVLSDSGFVIGAVSPTDPFTYTVSGGNTASWTVNQWKFYFNKSGTKYYPITANTTTTLSVAKGNADTLGTEIYQAQTIVNILNNVIEINILSIFQFLNIVLNQNTTLKQSLNIGGAGMLFTNCYFSSTGFTLTTTLRARGNFTYDGFNSVRIIIQSTPVNIETLYFFYNTNAPLVNLQNAETNVLSITNCTFENPSTAAGAGCLFIATENNMVALADQTYNKFINSNVAFLTTYAGGRIPNLTFDRIVLLNVNYLFRKNAATTSDYAACRWIIAPLYSGTPVVRYFFDSMFEFVNSISGRLISIVGITYPEIEQNLTATLTNNATTNVIVGNKLQNRSIWVKYTITRGTGLRVGSFDILNDGTNLLMTPDVFNDNAVAEVGDPAIVFTVNFNTNEIRIAATLNNSGNAATMKYSCERVMIAPLTI